MPAKKNMTKKTPTKKNTKTTVKKTPTKTTVKKTPEPVVEVVVEPVPIVEEVPVVPEPVATPVATPVDVPVATPVVEEGVDTEESEIDKLRNQLTNLQTYVNQMGTMTFDDLKKNFQKEVVKITKTALTHCSKVEKEYNKATKKKVKRAQTQGTGFEKKVPISDEFKKFIIGACKGTVSDDNLVSRKEGSTYIHTYIKGNNIQKPECKRHLQPDKALQSILGKLSDEVNAKTGKKDSDIGYTYFNLQKYLKGCYVVSA